LLSDWTTFFSEVGSSLASESTVNLVPATHPARLHLVEAKGLLGVSPASSRGQVSNPQALQRPPYKAVAGKSVRNSDSLMKLVGLRVNLVRWRTKLSDRFSSTLKSRLGTRTTAILIQSPERWLHAVRARYLACLGWVARGMNIADSIDWPRLRMSAFQWLREPCDPTRWRLPDSRLFGELLRFNHKKM
jgi:hypothetical protein